MAIRKLPGEAFPRSRVGARHAIARLELFSGRRKLQWPYVTGLFLNVGRMSDPINHPAHYGGADDPYEAIKIVEAWGLGFHLGNVIKYISRAGRRGNALEDLRKARWYLDREISNLERAHPSSPRTE